MSKFRPQPVRSFLGQSKSILRANFDIVDHGSNDGTNGYGRKEGERYFARRRIRSIISEKLSLEIIGECSTIRDADSFYTRSKYNVDDVFQFESK